MLRELRELGSAAPPVLVFSYLSGSGAAATMEALALGATDFVLKPTPAQGLGLAEDFVKTSVLPQLRNIVASRSMSQPEAAAGAAVRAPCLRSPARDA